MSRDHGQWGHARHHLDVRRRAAQATYDRFFGKPYELGRNDCGRMAAYDLTRMGWTPKLLRFGSYSTEASAAKALLRNGFKTVLDAVDDLGLQRIPPAMTLPGDLVSLPAEGEAGGLFVVLGNGRALGWGEGFDTCLVLEPKAYTAAWRA